jgi:uncharacterized protein (TIGR02598 family)
MQIPRHIRSTQAFSLIEVVLAIGVVSFAMVSILGLIPVGLTTFRNAMDLSVEAGIAQRLAGEVQRTDFANLSTTNYTFDDQGVESGAAEAVFTAQVDSPQALQSGGILPANAAARTVVIRISNRMHPDRTNSYPVVIPLGY